MEINDYRLNLIRQDVKDFSDEQIEDLDEAAVDSFTEAFMAPYIYKLRRNPQSQYFTKQSMQRFVSAVIEHDPERLNDFHLPRLRGIGGSEIAAVIGQEFDKYNAFKTRRDVVRDKLLLSYPQAPNGHMERGQIMEPKIRFIFRKNPQIKPLDAQLKMLATFNNTRLPWLVGTPDDLVEISGKNYLVDYKCPADPKFASEYSNDVPFDYKAQLHHYAIVCREAGIKIDGLLLCAMSASQAIWNPELIDIELSKEMFQAIEDIGSDVWNNNVLTGILPDFKKRRDEQMVLSSNEHSALILAKVEDAAVLNVVAKEAIAREKVLKEEIDFELQTLNVSGSLSHSGMKIESELKVNIQAMIDCLISHDVETNQFIGRVPNNAAMEAALEAHEVPSEEWTVPGPYNFEKMSEILIELGEDMDRFNEKSFKVSMTRSKRGPEFEILSKNKNDAVFDVSSMLAARKVAANKMREYEVKAVPEVANLKASQLITKVDVVGEVKVIKEDQVMAKVTTTPIEENLVLEETLVAKPPLKRKF